MGATFVARSFSGDKQQLIPLVKAAIAHGGTAFIRRHHPCVAFNNHAGSTKSYDYVPDHNEAVTASTSGPRANDQRRVQRRRRHRSAAARRSIIRLRKTTPTTTDRPRAGARYVAHHAAKGEVVTGLL